MMRAKEFNRVRKALCLPTAIFATLIAGAAWADPPRVVTDIAPVQSLVAAVMEGVTPNDAEPTVLIGPGMSPHSATLRPSAAKALAQADLVVWIGPDFEPWLAQALDGVASGAARLTLTELPETRLLPQRSEALFPQDHDHDHAKEHSTGHSDQHVWLDPENARAWVPHMAEALAARDPQNAARYRENAAKLSDDLAALTTELQQTLTPLKGRNILAYHDAFQYFETRFGLSMRGAVANSQALPPGARRIHDLTSALAEQPIACAITEPEFDTRLVTTVVGVDVPVVELEPLAKSIPPGPTQYPAMLRAIAAALLKCTAG